VLILDRNDNSNNLFVLNAL